MEISLIVPVNLQALCVGTEDVNGTPENPYGTINFARVAAEFSNLPYLSTQDGNPVIVNSGPNVSEAVLSPMFETTAPPLQPGIHLHWALPKALAQGVTGNDGSVQVRSAPNRWLVVRIATNHARPDAPVTAVNAWAVESDRLWDPKTTKSPLPTNQLSIAQLLDPVPDPSQIPNQPFLNVGLAFPYSDWKELSGGISSKQHTAFGYGELTYAAAYAQAPNVFGFYDTLKDLDLDSFPSTTTNISYMVAGWYANLDDDPLARLLYPLNATYASIVELIENTFGWTFTPDPSRALPSQIICNGILTGISWNPKSRYLQPPQRHPIRVAIGNTSAEAVSALLASQPALSKLHNVEGVLNALQLALLQRINLPDGLMQIEEAIHQAEFGSSTAGTIWNITPATPGNTNGRENVVVTGQDLLNAASRLDEALPSGVGDDLNQLNLLQQQADALQFEISSYRRQIFADWYKYMMLEYSPVVPTELLTATDAFNYLNSTIIPALNELLNTRQPSLAAEIGQQVDKIKHELGNNYLLVPIQAPRYWTANDPVVLLSGLDLSPFYQPRNPRSHDAKGNLICRLDTQLVTAMQITSPPSNVVAAQLPQLPDSPNYSNVVRLMALMGEAFFLDPNQAWVLAVAADKSAGELWQQIQIAQQNLFTDPAQNKMVTFVGQPPAPLGFQIWKSPWVPLLMEWEANYFPLAPIDDENSPTDYAPDFITQHFRLNDDAIDLVDINPPPSKMPPLEVYRGVALLTHNTEINIVNQINAYVQNYPNDPYVDELRHISEYAALPAMAQALGGFGQGLIMRKQTLQLPVFDPLAVTRSAVLYRFSNTIVPPAVGMENASAPLPLNSYNPLRAGFMQISRIWLVDIFGQKIEITPPPLQVIRAASLIPQYDDPGNPLVWMPPRIAQPGRLLFRWLSAGNDAVEMNSDPVTTPICGWVLFNHLDYNLAIYDASGTPMGSLNLRGPLWTGAPGNNETYLQPIQTVFANANPHLRDFALGIYNNPEAVAFLGDLLAAIDDSVTLINPQNSEQFQALSVLIGRPLAIVRASLRLDFEGLPAINQNWSSFAAAAHNAQPMTARDDAQFPSVSLPVRLGDLANVNDGLIGYFIDDGSSSAYKTFYAPASKRPSNGVVPPGPNQLLVSGKAKPIVLSLLMDPRAGIHATTGIVPVKQIQIPPSMFSGALNNIAVTFLTTPVLSSAAQFSVPVPKEAGYTWSWVSMNLAAKQWTKAPITPVNLNSANLSVQQASEGWLQLSKQLEEGKKE